MSHFNDGLLIFSLMDTYKSFDMELLLEENQSDYQTGGNNHQLSNTHLNTPFVMRGESSYIPAFPSNSQPNCTPFHVNGTSMNENGPFSSTNMISGDMNRFKYPPPNWKNKATKSAPVNGTDEAGTRNDHGHSDGHNNDNHHHSSSNGPLFSNSRNSSSDSLHERTMDYESLPKLPDLPNLPKNTLFNFNGHPTNNNAKKKTTVSNEVTTIDSDSDHFDNSLFNETQPGKCYFL